MPEWLVPWILAAVMIWPLVAVERWLHRHIQGLGLLLTNNPQAAVLMYYVVLLPGVLLHETSQWLLAKILRVEVKKFRLWPEEQQKLIRLGLVEIAPQTDTIRATLVGMVPLISGIAVIALISSLRFDATALAAALASGDIPIMLQGLNSFTAVPDFWVWVYLVFSIANAMLPEPHDRINWWLLIGVFAGFLIFLAVLDLGILIQAWVEGPMAALARWLSLALGMALVIDLLMMGVIALAEWIFSRVLDRELEYH